MPGICQHSPNEQPDACQTSGVFVRGNVAEEHSNDTIRTWPELGLAALAQRQDKPYRLYCLAQHLNRASGGSGIVSIAELRSFVLGLGAMSLRSFYRTISDGDPLFWQRIPGNRLVLRSPIKIAAALGIRHDRWTVELPAEKFLSTGKFRAALVQSLIATGKGGQRTIAQTTIADRIGRKQQTVSNYLKPLQRQTNALMSVRRPDDLTPELKEQGYYLSKLGGQLTVMRRMASTYSADLNAQHYGQGRRKPSSSSWQGAMSTRLYFSDAGKFARAIEGNRQNQQQPLYLQCRDNGRKVRDVLGSTVWTAQMWVGDSVCNL